jgi:glycosyltransferase involved in cell wall biosynthesis
VSYKRRANRDKLSVRLQPAFGKTTPPDRSGLNLAIPVMSELSSHLGSASRTGPAPTSLRVLLLGQRLGFGGAERQLLMLARGLSERGHDVTFAVLYNEDPMAANLGGTSVRIVDLAKRSRYDVVGFLRHWFTLIASTQPDVVHGYLPVPNLLTLAARRGSPRPIIVWGVRASNMDMSRNGWLDRVTRWLESWLSRWADLIIANSEAGAIDARRRGLPDDRIAVVANGIDIARFRPDAAARGTARSIWGIACDVPVVGHVARIDLMKDHATFLSAIAILRRSLPTVRAVCVAAGSEQQRAELRARAAAIGLAETVQIVAPGLDVTAVMNGFDVLCLSSAFGEGFPNVVGESMACGVPCVVTATGDAPALVGDTGAIVPPRDSEAMAAALLTMIARVTSEQATLADRTRAQIAPWTHERLVAATERLLMQQVVRQRECGL